MFTIKAGVQINGLQIEMRQVLIAASSLWKEYGQDLVITSGLEGIHTPASYHYYGYAVDLRTRYFDDYTIDRIVDRLKNALNDNYDVIKHKSHIHVEYDYEKAIQNEQTFKQQKI